MRRRNRKYPHLLPEDVEIWKSFLELYGDRYVRFDYDIRVGNGRDPGPKVEPPIRQLGIDLSRKRIDAVGTTKTEYHIIEITHTANIRAVGQLFVYPTLYQLTYRPDLPLRPLLVAGSLGTDIKPVLEALNLPFLICPPASKRIEGS